MSRRHNNERELSFLASCLQFRPRPSCTVLNLNFSQNLCNMGTLASTDYSKFDKAAIVVQC